jgi:hypothetical protein
MKMRHIIIGATALVFAASMASAFGPDVRDPGRLPKPDRPEVRAPTSTAPVAAQKASAASAEQDVRDPGHSTPPDKLRDGVRRR